MLYLYKNTTLSQFLVLDLVNQVYLKNFTVPKEPSRLEDFPQFPDIKEEGQTAVLAGYLDLRCGNVDVAIILRDRDELHWDHERLVHDR